MDLFWCLELSVPLEIASSGDIITWSSILLSETSSCPRADPELARLDRPEL